MSLVWCQTTVSQNLPSLVSRGAGCPPSTVIPRFHEDLLFEARRPSGRPPLTKYELYDDDGSLRVRNVRSQPIVLGWTTRGGQDEANPALDDEETSRK
jgi:hypothetical protein